MMEEVGTDESQKVTEQLAAAKIEDSLHEASQPAGSSDVAPPAPLPTQLSSPVMPSQTPPPASDLSSSGSPSPAGNMSMSGSAGRSGFSPSPSPPGGSSIYTPGDVPSSGVSQASPVQFMSPGSPPQLPYPQVATQMGTPGAQVPTPGAPPQMFSPSPVSSYQGPPPPQGVPQYVSPPGTLQSPYEASTSINLPVDYSAAPMQQPMAPAPSTEQQGGLFGWFSGSSFMNKVVEKTKTSVETMITTLDPGMKQVIYSGGDLAVTVTSSKAVKIEAVRRAFQEIFGRATVGGLDSQPNIAPQPVGYTAGLKGCEERIDNLRQSGKVDEQQPIVAIESFIVEMLPDRWYDVACVLLKDPANNIELQTFSQATVIPVEYVTQAQDQTPSDYNLRWSGLAVTVGQVIQQNMPFVSHSNWHEHFTGVSRQDMIYLATKSLAGMYKQRLPQNVSS